jgi:uncharacterized protein with von Willebrand factor type A (vWA) domain
MNNFFLPARGRAIELVEELSEPGATDHLHAIVVFAEKATVVDGAELPDLEFVYEYGSNLAEALGLAVASLSGQPGRAVLLSDLVATAHTAEDGSVFFSFPPAPDTVDRTQAAIRSCAEASIRIEAWRYYNRRAPTETESFDMRGAILDSGGNVESIGVEDNSPPGAGLDPAARYAG